VISTVQVPLFKPKEAGEKEIVRAYKQSKRRDDDIAIVTACFASRLDKDNIIKSVKLAFGGMAAYTIAAKKTEEFLLGKTVSSSTLQGAIDVLAEELNLPFTVPGGMASFRRTLAISFLFKYFIEVASQCQVSLDEIEGVAPSEKESLTEVRFALPCFELKYLRLTRFSHSAYQTRNSIQLTRQLGSLRKRSRRKATTSLVCTQSYHRKCYLPR